MEFKGNLINEYSSAGEIKQEWKRENIRDCCNNKQKTAYGYTWKYKSEEEIDGEIWKEINYKNYIFKVSNLGRIERKDGSKTYGCKLDDGYMKIHLNGISERIHRLVCQASNPIDNTEDFVVNHINHIRNDNRKENLQWVTPSENMQAYLKTKPNFSKRNHLKRKVIRIKNNKIDFFDSIKEAVIATKYSQSTNISKCCKDQTKTCGGFKWMYLEDYEKLKSS